MFVTHDLTVTMGNASVTEVDDYLSSLRMFCGEPDSYAVIGATDTSISFSWMTRNGMAGILVVYILGEL